MIVRPFKVAFCDIKNHYGNTKTNDIDNVMKEIITTVNQLKLKFPKYHRVNHFFIYLLVLVKILIFLNIKKFRN